MSGAEYHEDTGRERRMKLIHRIQDRIKRLQGKHPCQLCSRKIACDSCLQFWRERGGFDERGRAVS